MLRVSNLIGFGSRRTGSVPWTPSQISTTLWLDASDTATITQSGGAVSQWNDKSGNARHVTQSTAGAKPTTNSTTLNSLNVIGFDGGDNLFTSADFPITGNSAFSTFIVYKKSSATAGCAFGWGNTGTTLQAVGLYDDNSLVGYAYAGGNTFKINAISTATWMIHGYVKSAGAINTTSAAYKDGSDTASTGHSTNTPSIAASTAFNIGRWANLASNQLSGEVAEMIVVASAVSTDTRQKIEGYLAHKWGLTANLPGGHPYKTTAPTT